MDTETLPRQFGNYLLTAALGQDALGRVYRALRREGDRGFTRLRILETAELSNDALLDAIEQNGEIHGFLKNPAVARGVDMDSVEGSPYIAWNEPSGRTLDVLLEKCRAIARRVPVEHALLIAEKIATALDHAYNTTVDGDRTLHGLVWPGLVVISDDGEIRLSGFGLARGRAAVDRPAAARRGGRAVPGARGARERRRRAELGRLLRRRGLSTRSSPETRLPADALAVLKGAGQRPRSAGAARDPGAPSDDARARGRPLQVERRPSPRARQAPLLGTVLALDVQPRLLPERPVPRRDRARDAGPRKRGRSRHDAAGCALAGASAAGGARARRRSPRAAAGALRRRRILLPRERSRRRASTSRSRSGAARRRRVIGIIAAAAVAGGIYLVARRPGPEKAAPPRAAAPVKPTPTLLPELQPTPAGPTTEMTEAQFRDEVSRRLAAEVHKLEAQMRDRDRPPAAALAGGPVTRVPYPTAAAPPAAPTVVVIVEAAPTAVPTPVAVAAVAERPTPAPVIARIREGALVRLRGSGLPAAPRGSRQARLSAARAEGAHGGHGPSPRAGLREGRRAGGRGPAPRAGPA